MPDEIEASKPPHDSTAAGGHHPSFCSGVLFESLSLRRSFDGSTMRGNLTVKNYGGSEIKLALSEKALAKMVALMADELAAAAAVTADELRSAILQNAERSNPAPKT